MELVALLPLWGLAAVLANGALAHALDFEDAYDVAPSHPNAAVVPVAIGLAQHLGGISGEDLIAAIAVFAIAGPWMISTLVDYLRRTIESIPSVIG